MADRSRTSQRQQTAPGTLAVFKAAGHQFGAPASLWLVFSRFGARGVRSQATRIPVQGWSAASGLKRSIVFQRGIDGHHSKGR